MNPDLDKAIKHGHNMLKALERMDETGEFRLDKMIRELRHVMNREFTALRKAEMVFDEMDRQFPEQYSDGTTHEDLLESTRRFKEDAEAITPKQFLLYMNQLS